ncbi:MAG: hypothetical protein IJY90_01260 [Clostridia bacterium]|nr:hypothetical protein [Clostridia bacterium]
MAINFKEKFKILYEKIKKIKYFYLYLAIGIGIILVGIYLTCIPKAKGDGLNKNIDKNLTEISSSAEYVEYLENKLESVIGALNGVNSVEVAITLEKGFEYVYQTETETRTSSGGTSITTTTVVYVDGQPVIVEEIFPTVKGVAVVAQGLNDVSVRLNIISLIQTMVDVDTSQIKVME